MQDAAALANGSGVVIVFTRPSINLKDVPPDLHAQLKQEAEANFRSLTQETLARLECSFAFQDRLSAPRVNALIREANESGPEELLSRKKFDATRKRAGARHAAKPKAALRFMSGRSSTLIWQRREPLAHHPPQNDLG